MAHSIWPIAIINLGPGGAAQRRLRGRLRDRSRRAVDHVNIPGYPHKSIIRDNHEQSTVHAEQNAVADCAKRGVSCINCTAYITHYPCINCCKILLASGINEIVYLKDYKNDPIVAELCSQLNFNIKKIN